jgi:glycosyltransferase involved in cell wall biosynthesis
MRARYGIPPDAPYVLSLATLEIRKNLHQVIASFIRYLNENKSSKLHLVLAGMTGWKLDLFNESLSHAGEWRHRIILTGFVRDDDLSALYTDALCFVYLSRYEGFGLPPLEAMACGTPVICANNSSLPEVVGEAGLLFDEDDCIGVAKAIADFVGSKGLHAKFSALGLERAKMFNWDSCANIVANTIVANASLNRQGAHFRVTPNLSNLPCGPSDAPRASALGYTKGSRGPRFYRSEKSGSRSTLRAWPEWNARLPKAEGVSRVEGGLRMRGQFRANTLALPLISYLTIVRNNAKTIARTIESVQQQSYRNVEHIILDGVSTDGTLEVIERYADKLDYFVSEPDLGLYDALNKIVPLARGQLICILNADDWLEPNAAEIVVRHMPEIDSNGLLVSAASVSDGNEVHYWPPAFIDPGSYFLCANACHNAIYATPKAYEFAGGYDSSYKIAGDFKWIMSCIDAGTVMTYTDEVTVNFSLGGVSGNFLEHSNECMRVVRGRFPFLTDKEIRGLYHCFFVFSNAITPYNEDRPSSLTGFLHQLFVNHCDKGDFLTALSCALIPKFVHPGDR